MKFLYGLLFTLSLTLTLNAATYEGLVFTPRGKSTIALKSTGKKYLLVPANDEIASQISKLKSTDFVSLDGHLNNEQQIISVQSLNYVGLHDLLGDWSGDDDYCYSFASFSDLRIFIKNDKNKCDFQESHKSRDFGYTINPATQGWLVLLSDNDDSYLMDLAIKSKTTVELSLYDSQSGDILRNIKLKR